MKKSKLRKVTVGKYRFTIFEVSYEVGYACYYCSLRVSKTGCLFVSLIEENNNCSTLFGRRYAVYKYEEVK